MGSQVDAIRCTELPCWASYLHAHLDHNAREPEVAGSKWLGYNASQDKA